MGAKNGAGVAHRADDADARRIDQLSGTVNSTHSLSRNPPQEVINAQLIGNDACSADGLTARGSAPILALCHELIEAGQVPDTKLVVYRGSALDLIAEVKL